MVNTYSQVKDGKAIIGNSFYEVWFDKVDGSFLQIRNIKTGCKYIREAGGKQFYLWTLLADKRDGYSYGNDDQPYMVHFPGEEDLQSVRSENSSKFSRLYFSFILLDGIKVKTIFTAYSNELLKAKIIIDNGSKDFAHNQIVAVGFPEIENVIIDSDHKSNVLVRPNRFGELIPDPIGNAGNYTINLDYGGYASMQWQDLYSPKGGLYIASYDRELILGVLEAEPNIRRKTMRLGIRKYVYVPPGKKWESSDYVIGIHEGDWHWAADRYREWAETWIEKPRIPEWFKESDGWYGIGFHYGEKKKYSFKDIPEILEEARTIGLNHIQFWGQMSGPRKSCCYRFYYPDPRLGGEKKLKDSIRRVKEVGGHIGFYFNIQAFDPMLPDLPEDLNDLIPDDVEIPEWNNLKKAAQVHFDGSYVRQYPSRPEPSDGFRIMCLCAREWREYLKYWIIEKYVKEYRIDSVYVDQTFSPPISYCFNFLHGHIHHGDTVKCRVGFIKELREILKKVDPEAIIVIEGNGDSVGQYADAFLYTSFSSQTRFPKPEVFYYTFPYYVIIDGFANFPVEETMKAYFPYIEEVSYEDLINRVYLFGFKFDITLYRRLEKNEHLTKYIRKVIDLRKRIKRYLLETRFVDDIYIKHSPERVEAKMFLGDKIFLVNLLDYRDKKKPFNILVDSAIISMDDSIKSSKIYTFNKEEDISVYKGDNMIEINVPSFEEHIATILVEIE
ncbi:MAG: hypothetical protein B6U94_02990 [Thermofilum sp. ex4484_79]|nr:MAG: hypothetical protein B6U94_02990 [Thermofilum sp. ex4484_79]